MVVVCVWVLVVVMFYLYAMCASCVDGYVSGIRLMSFDVVFVFHWCCLSLRVIVCCCSCVCVVFCCMLLLERCFVVVTSLLCVVLSCCP